VENWTSITSVTRGALARRTLLDSRMGLDRDGAVLASPVAGWPGPGVAYTGFGEYGQRQILRLWSEYVA